MSEDRAALEALIDKWRAEAACAVSQKVFRAAVLLSCADDVQALLRERPNPGQADPPQEQP